MSDKCAKEDFLTKQIDQKRKVLLRKAELYGYESEITVKYSQELDQLISIYQKKLKTKKENEETDTSG
ncbi:aspartyl-phosphate phosphatase Spo0E family protein [Aquibacillus sediminis]|uniref:aspartyl-phosphate phosphatase Spo0E family protein n=1 Tax=Aquibacillus sediminis TaxID=2574734 RepID=UPI001107BA34|nr:aspartyl-phosphate phosphatase Spo0E family protein [Aquibacillus sediminis]